MGEEVLSMLSFLVNLVWNPLLLGLFLFVGLYFSLQSGFFQLFGLKYWIGETLGKIFTKGGREGLSPLQTLSTALAATIGTGSIAGVATAVTFGGAGAVFWMWASACLGMMTGCAEKTLSILCRKKTQSGWQGGVTLWLERKGHPLGAKAFAFCTLLASLGMGCLVQSNSLAGAICPLTHCPPILVGLGAALLTGGVLLGGLDRIGKVCERLVPLMGLSFLGVGGGILFLRREAILPALEAIFSDAFSLNAALGGGIGSAVRWGVLRGVCTNEAGLGSTPMVHCASANTDAMLEGYWGILEVFLSTIVVCTVTALVILTAGIEVNNPACTGAALSAAAFSVTMGKWGGWFVAISLGMFAFSTLLGWSWYGSSSVQYLLGQHGTRPYQLLFCLCIVLGSVTGLEAVWQLSDVANGLMAAFSLTALLLYRREIVALWREKFPSLPHL
jgi:AGCS family alanine or glycine:cation symporter